MREEMSKELDPRMYSYHIRVLKLLILSMIE